MSVQCEICGKKPLSGNNVSHSHRKTRRRWLPNIQKTKMMLEGREQRVKVCASCIRNAAKIK